MKKQEWRKHEKEYYMPKSKPMQIDIPPFKYITIAGEGSPASESFSNFIGVLYSVAYAIKMNLKRNSVKPTGYCDYTVYPLEGVWDLNEEARQNYDGTFNKDDLVFKLMIRQPGFVKATFFKEMIRITKVKKPNELLDYVQFKEIKDGLCVQMLHMGSYDDEPQSFAIMEEFASKENLQRTSKAHREIYLSDFRKVPSDKLKTVLRFKVQNL
ncbi:MAG: hypothetical protein HKN87_08370 [Saprospiraceae bacterium]|nr:hypothetical protein [Saprospiraceae bacterium]